jgi:8-oxo-dGTP pyrophosphatase MutT (NUDIX family)
LPDSLAPARSPTVRAKHAASIIVFKRFGEAADDTEMLMGMRGARHRFMPNRLVFPGGRVETSDMRAPSTTSLSAATVSNLHRNANPRLAYALAIAAARELLEETGLSLGKPPRLDVLHYLARAVTPPGLPVRFNARFFVVGAQYVDGKIGGDGELDGLRFYKMREALALDLATPTRRVLEQLQRWISMTTAERDAVRSTPLLLRDRGWVQE